MEGWLQRDVPTSAIASSLVLPVDVVVSSSPCPAIEWNRASSSATLKAGSRALSFRLDATVRLAGPASRTECRGNFRWYSVDKKEFLGMLGCAVQNDTVTSRITSPSSTATALITVP